MIREYLLPYLERDYLTWVTDMTNRRRRTLGNGSGGGSCDLTCTVTCIQSGIFVLCEIGIVHILNLALRLHVAAGQLTPPFHVSSLMD